MKTFLYSIALIAILPCLLLITLANGQNYEWAKKIGGANFDYIEDIAVDALGNVYVTGQFAGTVYFDPSVNKAKLSSTNGGYDVFIAKYNDLGNYMWAKKIGGTSTDNAYSLALDTFGNVYVTGNFWGTADFDPSSNVANLTATGDYDIFIAKYNSSGNYSWAKNMGGTSSDFGTSIAIDVLGNVCLTGYFNETVDFDPSSNTANLTSAGATDIFIAKFDTAGNYSWAQSMGGVGSEISYSLTTDAYANIVVTGFFSSVSDFDPSSNVANLASAGGTDIFIAKYDIIGNYTWAIQIGGITTEMGNKIVVDDSGYVFVTGQFEGTSDFDPSSNIANLTSVGSSDIFIAKYNYLGNYIWAIQSGSTTADVRNSLAIDAMSNIIVTGYFSGTSDFDPSLSTASLTSVGSNDIFMAKYNASGNYLSAKSMGGTGPDYGNSISIYNGNTVYLSGGFEDVSDFDPSIDTINLTSAGYIDMFFSKYSDIVTNIYSLQSIPSLFKIYPNPVSEEFTIEIAEQSFIQINTILGGLVFSEQLEKGKHTFSLSFLPNGVYTLSATQKQISQSIKFVVQK